MTMCAGTSAGSTTADLQAQLEATRAALIESQRLALAGTRAAMMAHEFNNLMTPVLARAMHAVQTGDMEMGKKALDRTVTQVQKAIELSRHLLRIADPDAETATETDVAVAVEEAIAESIRPFDKDGIDLTVDVPAGLKIKARPVLVEQVLLNLLVNAREAMKGMSGPLRISAEDQNGDVLIHVCDSGRGIDDDDIAERFAPFLSADEEAEPLDWRKVGLGLHVCRLIAHENGAQISVRANEGRGCTFTLRWPKP